MLSASGWAAAQAGSGETPPMGSSPAPKTILIFGDSMADGLWGGLARALLRDPTVKLIRRGKNGTGLARPDVYDWPASLPSLLDAEKPDAVILSFGLNDRQDTFAEGRRQFYFRTEAWRMSYSERIQALLAPLQARHIPTIWVGLPMMRDAVVSKDADYLNGLYQPAVLAAGATFFPIWEISADANRDYASHVKGPDGRMRALRAEDGMHFSPAGYDLLAQALLQKLAPMVRVATSP
jgi:uncharacterized protein